MSIKRKVVELDYYLVQTLAKECIVKVDVRSPLHPSHTSQTTYVKISDTNALNYSSTHPVW